MTAADHPELRRIRAAPEVVAWWGGPDAAFLEPEEDVTQLTIELDGRVAGFLQFEEELDPSYRSASIDLFIDPALRGRGIGAEAVRAAVCHLLDERGHHRVTIDPATGNEPAIAAYRKVGFRPVGVLRACERGPDGTWQDDLLMDLLAGEERREPLFPGGSRVAMRAEGLEPPRDQPTGT